MKKPELIDPCHAHGEKDQEYNDARTFAAIESVKELCHGRMEALHVSPFGGWIWRGALVGLHLQDKEPRIPVGDLKVLIDAAEELWNLAPYHNDMIIRLREEVGRLRGLLAKALPQLEHVDAFPLADEVRKALE